MLVFQSANFLENKNWPRNPHRNALWGVFLNMNFIVGAIERQWFRMSSTKSSTVAMN